VGIVTLTTDFGSDSSDVAVLKGALLREVPDVKIVDITHAVRKFDVTEAAYHLAKSIPHFPPQTTHIVCVRSAHSESTPHRVGVRDGARILAADTGIFALLGINGSDHKLTNLSPQYTDREPATFPELASFVPAAAHLARGGAPEALGSPAPEAVDAIPKELTFDTSTLTGEVIFVDGYGNAITNITRASFDSIGAGRPFTIHMRSSRMDIKKIQRRYSDVGVGERVAVFNSRGFLEIAVNNHRVPGGNGGADTLLGLIRGTAVRITFGPEMPETGFFGT
jgi:S-adenosylmethionine hydrolase